jgi:hypothetical protein
MAVEQLDSLQGDSEEEGLTRDMLSVLADFLT